jgi:hypothetical protein
MENPVTVACWASDDGAHSAPVNNAVTWLAAFGIEHGEVRVRLAKGVPQPFDLVVLLGHQRPQRVRQCVCRTNLGIQAGEISTNLVLFGQPIGPLPAVGL